MIERVHLRSAVSLLAVSLIAIVLSGCAQPRGGATLNDTATRFVVAVAAGDVATANRLSRADFTASQLAAWRETVFGSESTVTISSPHFVAGATGSDPASYFVIDTYMQDGARQVAGGTMFDQIGLQKYGDRWCVVSITGNVGRFR